MKHDDAIYSREEVSPDGSLHICYNYMEGEKSPTIVEPCVTLVATGEVILDFWRTRLNGYLSEFKANGFQLKVSDNYDLTTVLLRIDVPSRTFVQVNDSAPARPLAVLSETVFWMVEHARTVRSASSPPAPSRPSLLSRLAAWMS